MERLAAEITGLSDFPLVPVHLSDSENLYNVLDWQRVGSRRMLQHYLESEMVIQAMLEQCRYFHLPLGNMPKDTTLFGCDLFFARHLQKHNHVLWITNGDQPDLGGKEADDNRLLMEANEGESVEVNTPGCYNTVCIELDVASLAVNTLIQSSHVNDHEGASSVTFDLIQPASLEDMVQGQGAATTLASYDETALCTIAFRIMKGMVSGWIRDVATYQNVFADHQIINFYRWLRSPTAMLYDPALRRTLQNFMKKLFMQLVAEFKRLGSQVIYANFNRLLLCTKKRSVVDALAYVEYITNAIRSQELFHMIDISYSQCWMLLFWMDPANHGGIRGNLPKNLTKEQATGSDGEDAEEDEEQEKNEEEEELNVSDDEGDTPDVEMNWNLAKFLPEAAACQINFSMVVAGYILAVHQKLQEERCSTPGSTPVRRRTATQASQTPAQPGVTPGIIEYCQHLIRDDMSQQMFLITQKIQKKLAGTYGNISDLSSEFPVHAGSHLRLTNPALEFVKSVCQVLALDTTITIEMDRMKRNLLKLIGVGEFSDTAKFADPCLSYLLPEVICKSCNHIRDLDLCRDPYMEMEPYSKAVWSCIQCKTAYDLDEIEETLLSALQRKSMAYVLQDVVCAKCGGIKEKNLEKHCACGGKYTVTLSLKSFSQTLQTFRNIANQYNMEILEDSVSWHLQMNPQVKTVC